MKKLDAIDKKILRTLQSDGRITNKNLAEKVGLSETPCWQRVRRLEKDGFIGECIAQLDPKLLGAPDLVIVEVTLKRNDRASVAEFQNAIQDNPNILEAHMTTGDFDVLLLVALAGTRGCQEFLYDFLYEIPSVEHSTTSFTLDCYKSIQAHVPD